MQGAVRFAADARLFVKEAKSVSERVVLSGCVPVEGALVFLMLKPPPHSHFAGVIEALNALFLGEAPTFTGLVGVDSRQLVRHQKSVPLFKQLEVWIPTFRCDSDAFYEEMRIGEMDTLVVFGVFRVDGKEGT